MDGTARTLPPFVMLPCESEERDGLFPILSTSYMIIRKVVTSIINIILEECRISLNSLVILNNRNILNAASPAKQVLTYLHYLSYKIAACKLSKMCSIDAIC